MTVRRGIDPRTLALVTGGGATGVAAVTLARELGITRVLVPQETSVLCAYGALNADLRWSSVASHPTSLHKFDYSGVNTTLTALLHAGAQFLDRFDVPPARRRLELYAAARYPMQITELEVSCPVATLTSVAMANAAAAFHALHRARYAVAEEQSDVEFVTWRVVARAVTTTTLRPTPMTHAAAYLGDTRVYDALRAQWCTVPMLDPERLTPHEVLRGPALLVATDTTVVLPEKASATARGDGYLAIDLSY